MPMIRATASVALFVLASSSSALAAPPTKEACVAANEAAQDLRQAGKLREAREKLLLCIADACPGPVREDCAQRLNDVNAAMPTLVFEVKDPTGNDVSAARVTMDGQLLVDKLTGSAVAIDPGQHHFIVDDGDGLAHGEQTVVVREGDHDRHVRIVLGPTGTSQPAGETPASGPQSEPPATADSGSSQRMIGLVLGGAGVVGLAVGSIFGLVSKGTYDHALQSECGGNKSDCSMQGAQDGQTAHSQATVSTVGFVAGGLLAAGGAVLYFTAPKAGAVGVGPMVGTAWGGMRIMGAW
jgi:hypothetical protein